MRPGEWIVSILALMGGFASVVSLITVLRYRTASLMVFGNELKRDLEQLRKDMATRTSEVRQESEAAHLQLRTELDKLRTDDIQRATEKLDHLVGLFKVFAAEQTLINKFLTEALQRDSLRIEVMEQHMRGQ